MQLDAQRGSRLALGGRQRIHHFAPQRLDLLLGVFGERLLLGRALVFGNIERFTQLWLESCKLLVVQHTARPLFDVGDLVLHRLEARFVVFLRPVVGRLLVSGRDLGVFQLGRRENRLQPVVIRLKDGIELVIVAARAAYRQ